MRKVWIVLVLITEDINKILAIYRFSANCGDSNEIRPKKPAYIIARQIPLAVRSKK
jgi:hypothetical protein